MRSNSLRPMLTYTAVIGAFAITLAACSDGTTKNSGVDGAFCPQSPDDPYVDTTGKPLWR